MILPCKVQKLQTKGSKEDNNMKPREDDPAAQGSELK